MSLLAIIIFISLVESAVSFAGGILAIFNAEKVKKAAHFIVSFATGALLGVALLELIPEALEMGAAETILPFVLGGFILFFVLEKLLFWYHCHDGNCPVHTYAYLILWGDFLHNFIDGVMIALAFLVDWRLGFFTAAAVAFHEIPQEIGDFGILIRGGLSVRRALFYNFLVALSVVLGAFLTYVFGAALKPYLPFLLAIVAGNFLYVAAVDLMPELHEASKPSHTFLQIFLLISGVLIVMAPDFLF